MDGASVAARTATKKSKLKTKAKKSTKLRLAEKMKSNAKDISDEAVLNFIENAYKGEKKTEAGVKYWFEQTIPGHETEEGKGSKGSPDGYTPGWLLLELKSKEKDWVEGLFEGISRKELSFRLLVVITHKTLLVFPSEYATPDDWSPTKTREWQDIVNQAHKVPGSPSSVGKKLAQSFKGKAHLLLSYSIFRWSTNQELSHQKPDQAIRAFKKLVTSLDPDKARIRISPRNFKQILESLLPFFNEELSEKFEVVHGFFRCMSYWNKKYKAILPDNPAESDRVYVGGGYFRGLKPGARDQFIQAINRYEISEPNKARFYAHYDRAIDAVDPGYRANHGIYFTNEYLARLGISLAEEYLGSLADKYIVFDPACGSGNLVTSWNHHLDLRHKVVSEISPLLLQAFELRFQNKSSERKRGFTIIPKTSSGEGLNFVDRSADDYLEAINKELKLKNEKLKRPLAIICNPPYRNQKSIKDEFYKYEVHQSLVKIAGKDASNELFVAFLAQISEICRLAEEHDIPPNSVVLLFTKTVWLTGKSSYKSIKNHFLKHFEEKMGFVVNGSQFFDVKEQWPLMVTLWKYDPSGSLDPNRRIEFENLVDLKKSDLKKLANDEKKDYEDLTHWGTDEVFVKRLKKTLKTKAGVPISFNAKVEKLKAEIPPQSGEGNKEISKDMIERNQYLGGLCFASEKQQRERFEKFQKRVLPIYEQNIAVLNQKRRDGKKKIKKIPSFKVQGDSEGNFIGFTEAKQPYRTNKRALNDGSTLYFLMDTRFMKMHTSQCFSGIPTTRGHMVQGLNNSEKNLIIGYAMAQALAYKYPIQFDQFDMWVPSGDTNSMNRLLELAAAFLFARNGCIECEVPANHPEKGTKRCYVENPLSPNKGNYYWENLRPLLRKTDSRSAKELSDITSELYNEWRKWISKNPEYRAKAKLAIYSHEPNRVPADNWGIYQIEMELSTIEDSRLSAINEKRKKALNIVADEIRSLLDQINYWSQ